MYSTIAQHSPCRPPRPHRVKLVGEDHSGLTAILAANRRVELAADKEAGASGSIFVIDGKMPEKLPSGALLVFNPSPCDFWQLGTAVADPLITRVEAASPVTGGVRLFDAYLPDARQFRLAESVRAVATPILWAGASPMGYAIDRADGRIVVIAGDLAAGNLALQAGFPQLIAQALDWLDSRPPWKDEVLSAAQSVEAFDALDAGAAADIRVPVESAVRHRPWSWKNRRYRCG